MSEKQQADFSDLSEIDAVRLVANTAILAGQSHEAIKTNSSKNAIIIVMYGYNWQDGDAVRIEEAKEVDNDE